LSIKIMSDGVPVVRGQVVVTGPTGKTQTLTLKNGTVTFTAAWLYSGSRTLRIDYLGSYRVVARTRSQTVVIK
jgi:hypothetical protein